MGNAVFGYTNSNMTDSGHKQSLHIASADAEERLSDKIKDIRIKEREQLTRAEADSLSMPYINLQGFPIAPETLGLLSKEEATAAQMIPFFLHENELRFGMMDPANPRVEPTIEAVRKNTKNRYKTVPYLISEHSFDFALRLYDAIPKFKHYVPGVHIDEAELQHFRKEIKTIQNLGKIIVAVPFASMVNLIIAGALETRASDIHVEAEAHDVKVRYRIDGFLHDVAVLEQDVWQQLISRMKLLAKVKLNIQRTPQDGRFTIFLADDQIDVRVSFLPTSYGESVVIRILRSSAAAIRLSDLGLREKDFKRLTDEIARPNGMILTTGPTGSGKTTTLCAVLNVINSPDRKIITLENPIEYRIPGINQSQVDEAAGYTFARGLRSILRQDPDVLMVGEIRDEETADLAINAALTGHLVFSTLHTNNAAGAVPRLLAMNVKPYLLAPALNMVVAQRLVRRLCPNCKVKMDPASPMHTKAMEALKAIPPSADLHVDFEKLEFFEPKGCEACQGIGFQGQLAIFELFTMNTDIEKLVLENRASEREMHEIAINSGMITMAQDGLLKAAEGVTSIAEVFKVAL